MGSTTYYREDIETMERDILDEMIDERTRYTVQYANPHSPFYRKWFADQRVDPSSVRTHEDFLKLPLISGSEIRAHQPPVQETFGFKSAD